MVDWKSKVISQTSAGQLGNALNAFGVIPLGNGDWLVVPRGSDSFEIIVRDS